jgi:hypothetical protein
VRNVYTFFVEIVEGETPLERPKCGYEHAIKINLK